jgi:O-antigen ligase
VNAWSAHSHAGRQSTRSGSLSIVFFLASTLMLMAFFCGGASRTNAIPVTLVELASIPLLIALFSRPTFRGDLVLPYILIGLIVAIPLLQLIPLPHDVWAGLPGREAAATAAQLAGATGWKPLSLAPQETWGAMLALAPPISMFLATVTLSSRERMLIVLLVIAAGVLNLTFGVGQLTTGESSPLYLYENTSRGAATGLFSNRNHYAVFLVAVLPMVAVWLKSVDRGQSGRPLIIAGGLAFIALLLVGVIMGRSRAAAILILPSLVGTTYVIWKSAGPKIPRRTLWTIIGGASLILGLALIFGLQPLMERFGGDVFKDVRFAAAPVIWENAARFLPFGSGIGSFEAVYQSFEPSRLITSEFLNHAHDDYLEIWLETGFFGAAALLVFAVWWVVCIIRAASATGIYADLARVGAIITTLLLVHSLVDYPLRTEALATLFAFACALLATPTRAERRRDGQVQARPN